MTSLKETSEETKIPTDTSDSLITETNNSQVDEFDNIPETDVIPTVPNPSPSTSPEILDEEIKLLTEKCQTLEKKYQMQSALQETALEEERLLTKSLQQEIQTLLRQHNVNKENNQRRMDKLEEEVQLSDKYIGELLSQLQKKQEAGNYCPWTWFNKFTKDPNWVYGVIGLIFIVGGTRIIYH